MGCAGSKALALGLTTTPCIEYAESRRKAGKAVEHAHEDLLKAASSYAEALKAVGSSLRVAASATNIFDSSAPHPPGHPQPPPPPESEPLPNVAEENNLQIVAAPADAQKKQQLEDIATRIDALFLDMAGTLGKSIQGHASTASLSRNSMPPLTAAASKNADGQWEPIGSTLLKLTIWEEHLRDDVKAMEHTKHELGKKDKKLQKKTMKASKDPSADLQQVRGAQTKLNAVSSQLTATQEAIKETYKAIEVYKAEVILPQVTRLLPLLASFWKESEATFRKQEAVALDVASLKAIPPSVVDLAEDPALLSSSTPLPPGGCTRAYHEATKGLDDSLAKWSKSLEELSTAQRKFTAALLGWVRATMSVPGDFPRPTPEELVALPKGPAQMSDQETSFGAFSNEWTKSVDGLPEVQMKEAIAVLCKALKTAYQQQIDEVKESRNVDNARKDVLKLETKLSAAEKKLEEIKRGIEETRDVPEKAKEHEVRQHQLELTTTEVEVTTSSLAMAKGKFHAERLSYARRINEECITVGTALQGALPETFRYSAAFAAAAATAYAQLQAKHAPFLTPSG